MKLLDLHTHPYSHGEKYIKKNYSSKYLKRYIKSAENNNINILGFSDHDQFMNNLDWDSLIELKESEQIKILLGMEFDYIPGSEDKIKNKINKYPLDYTIGSVHNIDKWPFDHPDYKEQFNHKNIFRIYEKYFNLVKKAVESKMFNIIGHLDLIKIYNYRIDSFKLEKMVKPVLETINKNNLIIEINTNGLNKPIKEIYPSINILKMAYKMDIPITLGSDAHRPERVGENFNTIIKLIKDIGYDFISYFENNQIKHRKIRK
ncbi:MAG: histidinol-phosphatase [bacterium]